MQRYDAEVLVRPAEPTDGDCQERSMKCNVTATCEIDARHQVLERAWGNDLLVSRFLSIQQRSMK